MCEYAVLLFTICRLSSLHFRRATVQKNWPYIHISGIAFSKKLDMGALASRQLATRAKPSSASHTCFAACQAGVPGRAVDQRIWSRISDVCRKTEAFCAIFFSQFESLKPADAAKNGWNMSRVCENDSSRRIADTNGAWYISVDLADFSHRFPA